MLLIVVSEMRNCMACSPVEGVLQHKHLCYGLDPLAKVSGWNLNRPCHVFFALLCSFLPEQEADRRTTENRVSSAEKALAESKRKKIMVLMSDTGGGHRASAEALKAGFDILYGDKYKVY